MIVKRRVCIYSNNDIPDRLPCFSLNWTYVHFAPSRPPDKSHHLELICPPQAYRQHKVDKVLWVVRLRDKLLPIWSLLFVCPGLAAMWCVMLEQTSKLKKLSYSIWLNIITRSSASGLTRSNVPVISVKKKSVILYKIFDHYYYW